MGWFTKAVGFLAGSGGSGSDNVMKVASGIGSWIDNNKYTDQEKAIDTLKIIGHFDKFMENTVNENSEKSKTRRDVAILVIRAELGFLLASALAWPISIEYSKFLLGLASETSPWGLLTLGVGAFFFGTHLLRAKNGAM